MASSLVGQAFPEDVTFQYVPYSPEKADLNACGIPVKFDASKDFKDKKVVLVAVPGAFTRTCSEKHIPTFVQHQDALKAKGVDKVVVIAYNVKDDGRTQRYALIVDHGKITYAGVSDTKGVIEGTDAASVLAHL
ncbi:peroxiredoxin type-2 [Diaporthe amygdali]|uniref:peroxiredoxin type-2 n=1 Tax=Phomopsis amygdali TaxID=1214568 RepID=UPI0022FF3506|nr:peroxiredoxin type-2 [Diaporthe amygdali]KAJ0117909.1 peroxiredoxin type-2 [Diaporthe amygdali]